ncbi:MAG: holo-ACP synthase [Lachnospiraceae bacterium]|nr:holo-ACP synthase [Lachnospiraceae bacterium]MBQ2041507.1 holo-ACP synthase [Lachnospiraceae bacterium]
MIVGVGTDLIELKRVQKACGKPSFLSRIFTEDEYREASGDHRRLAGNFAVKEAVSKALGTGFGSVKPREIEVFRDRRGKPYVKLSGKAKEQARLLKVTGLEVSISDTEELVLAFAVAEGAAVSEDTAEELLT